MNMASTEGSVAGDGAIRDVEITEPIDSTSSREGDKAIRRQGEYGKTSYFYGMRHAENRKLALYPDQKTVGIN